MHVGRSLSVSAALLLALGEMVAALNLGTTSKITPRLNTLLKNSTSSLTWYACPSWLNQTMTCTNLSVPLDWNNPDGENIQLGLAKLAARDPSRRIGYLLVNPGGPGNQGSGSLSITARTPQRLDPDILDRFDLIGLDPRGVGLSTPVQCDKDVFNKRVKYHVKTQEEYDFMVANNKAVWESCLAKTGRLMYFMDTTSAARDHEAVRLALGGEKLSFAGLSYGSQLYAQYAELYPDGIRAMLLDGALQHSQGEAANILIESTTYESTLKQLFAWCRSDTKCPLHNMDLEAVFHAAVALAKAGPIPAPGCDGIECPTDLSEEELYATLQGALDRTVDWPDVAQALNNTANGDASDFASSIALRTGNVFYDSDMYAYRAVLCQDWTHQSSSFVDLQQKQIMGEALTPLVKGHSQSYNLQAFCIGWGAPVTNPPRPLKYNGTVPILLTNAIYDPETSYTWAMGMQHELGNAVLLTRNGSGHTSIYTRPGETAAAEAAYLLDLTLPAPGTMLGS